jgi:hypothetical protein
MFVVSKLSVVKFKLLAKLVLQQACGQAADEAKLAKLVGDGKLDAAEVKGVVASLHFILASSARHAVAEEALALELQQLGLPKEHTEALVAVLRDGRAALQRHLAEASLRQSKLESLRWRVEEDPSPTRAHAVELQLAVRAQATPTVPAPVPLRTVGFRLSADMFTLLHSELKGARELLPATHAAS